MNPLPTLRRLLRACAASGFVAAFAWSATGAAPAASARELAAFYIGHSLISDVPDMVQSLAASAPAEAGRLRFQEQFTPGAPLRWHWDQVEKFQGEPRFRVRYDHALASGRFDVLVVTDGVPRGGAELEAETADYLARFTRFAREHNPAIRVYYYETWHTITSGTPENSPYDKQSPRRHLRWRERLDADRAMWESIVDAANRAAPAAVGSPPIRIIPAGQALARFDDAVRAGKVPGLADTRAFFHDDIHLNHYGKYLVACVHYAVLFGRPPTGLAIDLKERWGRDFWDAPTWDGKRWPRPDPAAVRVMQEIAWETVAGHPRTGVEPPAR